MKSYNIYKPNIARYGSPYKLRQPCNSSYKFSLSNIFCSIWIIHSVIANSALECFTISRGQHHPTGAYVGVKTCSINKA